MTFDTYGHASAQHAFDLDTAADWNVGKTGYSLTTADWNVGKTGYSLTATTGLGNQTANITGTLSGSVGSVSGDTKQTADVAALITTVGAAGAGLTNLGASGNNWNTVIPDAAGVAPTAAEIETEVWDGLQSAHVVPASMGILATEIAALQTDLDTVTAGVIVTTNNDKTGYALTTANWNVGKTGYTVSTVSDKTGYSLSTAGILAIWHQLTSAIVTASTIGKLLVDNINATIASAATATGFATNTKQDTMETTLNAAATAAALTTVQGDTDDIQTRLPAALVGGRMDADMGAISTSATAADNLEQSTLAIIFGTSVTGTLSTTQSTSDLTGYVNSELVDRAIVWNSGTANGQMATITAYASASGLLTFADSQGNPITTAPVNNDTFVIV